MSDYIKITSNFEEVISRFRGVRQYIEKQVYNLVGGTALKLVKYLRTEKFGPYPSGTTEKTLSIRSKKLWRSITPLKPVIEGTEVKGGISIGTSYAKTHFGKKGQVTTITGKPWLTIPLPGAMDSHGVSKGGPKDKTVFGNTFFAKSKAGNIILFGKLKYTKGSKAGQTKGDAIPLFVLKHEVHIPVRITDEDIQRFVQPILGKGLKVIKEGIQHSTLVDVNG